MILSWLSVKVTRRATFFADCATFEKRRDENWDQHVVAGFGPRSGIE
jgi:hypothetical protein